MLLLGTIFWAGNFIVGKLAFIEDIPPFSLVFFRWLTVWFILLPRCRLLRQQVSPSKAQLYSAPQLGADRRSDAKAPAILGIAPTV